MCREGVVGQGFLTFIMKDYKTALMNYENYII